MCPTVSTDAVRAALDEITRLTSAPLWLTHKGRGWTITPEVLRTAMSIERDDSGLTPTS